MKKNPEKADTKPAPRSGLNLADLVAKEASTKTNTKTASPGSSMGYQDKADKVPMPSQAAPQFMPQQQPPRQQPPPQQAPQPVGLPQPTRPRNPAAFSQPMQASGMQQQQRMQQSGGMQQPVRPNLAQTVKPGYVAATRPEQSVHPGQTSEMPRSPGDFARGQITKADNIATAARRVPTIGMPFPGCHGISDRASYAAFIIQPCKRSIYFVCWGV